MGFIIKLEGFMDIITVDLVYLSLLYTCKVEMKIV